MRRRFIVCVRMNVDYYYCFPFVPFAPMLPSSSFSSGPAAYSFALYFFYLFNNVRTSFSAVAFVAVPATAADANADAIVFVIISVAICSFTIHRRTLFNSIFNYNRIV